MKYAVFVPNVGTVFGDPHFIVNLAIEAEEAGWDGFFLWDHIAAYGAESNASVIDPWITLTAIATRTNSLIIGTGVTPVPRRRPWKLARETVTLDHLSQGRLRLGVGIGTDVAREYSGFGEAGDDITHGEMLDEGLEVLSGLWSAQPYGFQGKYYKVSDVQFVPAPLQQPRIPIWVAGFWPHKKPFRRAARWDGIWPFGVDHLMTPDEIREMRSYIQQYRTSAAPFDIVFTGETRGTDRSADVSTVADYAEAGVTWWIEGLSEWRGSIDEQHDRLRRGPPRG